MLLKFKEQKLIFYKNEFMLTRFTDLNIKLYVMDEVFMQQINGKTYDCRRQ